MTTRRWPRRLLTALLLVALMAISTYVMRDPIATAMFAGFTSLAPGITCTHPDIELAGSLTRIEMEPFECKLERGPVQALRTSSLTRIELHGLQPPVISIAEARIDKRERDVSSAETNTLGDLGNLVGMTDPLVKNFLDEAESYDTHAPEVRVEKLSAFRGGKRENVLHGFRRWVDGEWMRSHAARIEGGTGPVDVRNMNMRVTPTSGDLSLALFLGEAERGERPDTALTVSARGLDKPKPRFDFELQSPDQRTARARD